METVEICPVKQEALEELPPLFQIAESKSISGFDSIQGIESTNPSSPSTSLPAAANGFESVPFRNDDAASQSNQTLNVRAVSISMPCSPLGERRVLFADSAPPYANKGVADHSAITIENTKHVKFHSQPISYVDVIVEPMVPPLIPPLVPQLVPQLKNPRIDRLKDKRYDSFKTWSGKLERQLSHIGGRYTEPEPEADASQNTTVQPLPVDRYFDALEGPELETLRPSEELLLPEDKQWPFLLRYPISSFGICLGTSSQAILWKALATSTSTSFLHVNLNISLVLWCISIALVAVVTVIYLLKVIFYFEAIRREYYHPIRVNFFFAPWIALLFLALGVPPSIVKNLHPSTWYILMAPLFCLELKIYGQWMSGGRRRLSKVANPSNHLAVVGNFVGALLGATMGLKEGPIFFFAVGLAHYTVLFVTLYQRLPTNETLPKDLHPVFFLFVAAPSVASMAWGRIQESFDYGSRIAYFIALFLYISLAVRVNFFRGFKFSLAWWAYTFPMTGAAIATIRYANEVKHPVTQSLAVILSAIATLIVTSLLVSTIIHAFVLKDLFPNDIAIAISVKRKKDKRSVHLKSTSSDTKTAEHVRTSRNSF